jgi:tryptophanyl-tRNA synthetase
MWARSKTGSSCSFEYDCYFLIADYQVSDYASDLQRVRNAVWDVALDWLAVGLIPKAAASSSKAWYPSTQS